jgi:hypothetical protein
MYQIVYTKAAIKDIDKRRKNGRNINHTLPGNTTPGGVLYV